METSSTLQNATPSDSGKAGARAVVFVLAILAFVVGMAIYFFFVPNYKTNQILKNGLQAEGVITAIEPTGTYYNDQPEARITIEARTTSTVGQGTTFTTQARKVINPLYAPQFQPGKRVLIRYLPEDMSNAAIEFVQGP